MALLQHRGQLIALLRAAHRKQRLALLAWRGIFAGGGGSFLQVAWQALQRLGRSGVPVYLLQAPGGQAPRLLGEVLSVDEVLQALDALR